MEPQLPSPISPEQGPRAVSRENQTLNVPEAAPQPAGSEKGIEQHQETREQQPASSGAPAPQQPVTASPPPLPQITTAPADTGSTTRDDNPAIAADEDLIEKEWVEKAKKVISETKHDPYLQEQAVSKLQADYLQKRYNKTVKVPNDAS